MPKSKTVKGKGQHGDELSDGVSDREDSDKGSPVRHKRLRDLDDDDSDDGCRQKVRSKKKNDAFKKLLANRGKNVVEDEDEEEDDTLPVRAPLPILPPRTLSVPPSGENSKCCICSGRGFLLWNDI